MVANKYAFLQITRRRFLNEWEAFKKVISRRNIRRRITIPLTLSNLKLLRRITRRSEERFSRNAETDLVCRLLLEKKKKLTNHQTAWPPKHAPGSLLSIITLIPASA